MKKPKLPVPCCKMMRDQFEIDCDEHGWDCQDRVIHVSKRTKGLGPRRQSKPSSWRYGIRIPDGSCSFYEIKYCPFCGKSL